MSLQQLLKQLSYEPENPILFNSGFFLVYLAVFMALFQLVYKNKMHRVMLFIAFSLYFFYKACGVYVSLVLISAVVDFNLSNLIYKTQNKQHKKWLLAGSIVINLGLLFYFKYTDFFIDIINNIGKQEIEPLNLILPIGISFYTFENLSYTVDVYKGQFKPVKHFADYLFFLSFFPKLVMGPIVRAADFIPQIEKDYHVSSEHFAKGFFLILGGLFKKVVISDFIYINFVRYVFEDPGRHTGLECLLAVYGYALVIYCDFSGYSDMAIGMARWVGFDININFLSPYQSKNITEFWRRWHISLSSWLRDYLYIPLGGNRLGKTRQYINLMITMLIGGLWHGASFTFVIWGALHGIGLAIHKWKQEVWGARLPAAVQHWLAKPRVGVFLTFHFVCLSWIFFKAERFDIAFSMLHQIFFNFNIGAAAALFQNYKSVFAVMVLGYYLHSLPNHFEEKWIPRFSQFKPLTYALLLAAFIWMLIQVKTAEVMLPIYLQF